MRAARRLLSLVGIGCLVVAVGACGEAAARRVAPPPGSVIAAPAPGGPLSGIACVNASTCWAVGGTISALAGSQAVVERSSELHWSRAQLPATPRAYGYALYAVACVSTARCWAVGSDGNTSAGPGEGTEGSAGAPLIEEYDGVGWSLVEPGATALGSGTLRGVACVSASDCWAVGSTGGINSQPLLVHHDGVRWRVAAGASPDRGGAGGTGGAGELDAVTCQRDATCWAVGSTADAGGRRHALSERFDGTRWNVVGVADPAASTSTASLDGVACTADADCWAVGTVTASGRGTALIEHLVGGGWKAVAAAKPLFSVSSSLSSVACAHAAGCWAGGVSTSPTGAHQVLVERTVGSAWSIVAAPALEAGATGSAAGVSCSDEDDCWTVGACTTVSGGNPCGGSTSLIEFYDTILPDGH